jgi:hypothetical protein
MSWWEWLRFYWKSQRENQEERWNNAFFGYLCIVTGLALVWSWVAGEVEPWTLLLALAFGLVGMLVLAWLRPWPFRRRGTRSVVHRAAVHDVPQPPSPYFVAICECGWVGGIHSTPEKAFEDARAHTPTVDAEVRRPLEEV